MTNLTNIKHNIYDIKKIICNAQCLMEIGVEPKSAIKQAASNCGVPYGNEMGKVVKAVLRLI